jgi:hypothetical protein
MRNTILAALAVAVSACPKEPKVYVQCQIAQAAVVCNVTHQQGSEPIQVCWDLLLTCRNSQRVTGHACHRVPPQGQSSRTIPEGDLQGVAYCDAIVSFEVQNIRLGATP